MDSAKKAYASGAFNKSLMIVEELLRTYPDDAEAYFIKGNIHHVQGKIGSAIKAFKKVLDLNSDNTDAMISLSVLYNDVGKYEEAKKFFNQADNKVKKDKNGVVDNHINKKFSAQHFEIAEMYFSYGRYDEASREYKRAYELDETSLMSKVKTAKCYSKKRLFGKALDELRALKREHPNYIPARLALALQYYSEGRVIEAQSEWKSVLDKNPNQKEAVMYMKLSQAATEVSL